MVRRIGLLLIFLLLLLALPTRVKAPEPDELFIPPDLQISSLVACYIGGNADGTSDSLVQVDYGHDKRASYHALIARSPRPDIASKVCKEWWGRVEKEFEKLERGKRP